MVASAHLSYEDQDQDSVTLKWVVSFVVLSLLAHALIILIFFILSRHIPLPNPNSKHQTAPEVSITMVQPPKTVFMPTPEQKNAKHTQQQVESDHDTQLASKSKTRKDDTIMPDVESKAKQASSLQESPSAPPVKAKDQTTTPPSPAKEQAKPEQQPPQPKPQPQPQPEKAQPQQAQKPPPPKAQPAPQQQPPPPSVDENGLPVLPALNAPTLAPQATASAQPQQVAAPPPMMPVVPMNVQGKAGMSGQPTPAAMKTDLGQYKAMFYTAVGSRWYPKVSQQMQLIGVGAVRIQYTIMPDGTITTRVLDDGGSSGMILLSLSLTSIQNVSPFRPFPPSMLKDYPNGYTDDFTFSIYGQ